MADGCLAGRRKVWESTLSNPALSGTSCWGDLPPRGCFRFSRKILKDTGCGRRFSRYDTATETYYQVLSQPARPFLPIARHVDAPEAPRPCGVGPRHRGPLSSKKGGFHVAFSRDLVARWVLVPPRMPRLRRCLHRSIFAPSHLFLTQFAAARERSVFHQEYFSS